METLVLIWMILDLVLFIQYIGGVDTFNYLLMPSYFEDAKRLQDL